MVLEVELGARTHGYELFLWFVPGLSHPIALYRTTPRLRTPESLELCTEMTQWSLKRPVLALAGFTGAFSSARGINVRVVKVSAPVSIPEVPVPPSVPLLLIRRGAFSHPKRSRVANSVSRG